MINGSDISMLVICFAVILVVMSAVFSSMVRRLEEKLLIMESKQQDYENKYNYEREYVGKLLSRINRMEESIQKVDEVIEDYSEAAKLAKDGEKLFNEGLENILNYSPTTRKKKAVDKV